MYICKEIFAISLVIANACLALVILLISVCLCCMNLLVLNKFSHNTHAMINLNCTVFYAIALSWTLSIMK